MNIDYYKIYNYIIRKFSGRTWYRNKYRMISKAMPILNKLILCAVCT